MYLATGAAATIRLHSTVILNIPQDDDVSLSQLEDLLNGLKGVANASVNPVQENVTVEFDPSKITVEKIRAAFTHCPTKGNSDKESRKSKSRRKT